MDNTTVYYVGIDVSKDKSDICIKDENGNDLIHRFEITNKRADLESRSGEVKCKRSTKEL